MKLGDFEWNERSLTDLGIPRFKSDQDSLCLLGISFSTNIGNSKLYDQIGLHKLVMNGLGRRVDE